MEKRRLGNTDLEISALGFGTFALGGEGWPAAWGPQDDEASIKTIQHALDLGMNWIDTAAVYGFGHAEEVVARALKGRSERPYIFTKCSRRRTADGKIAGNLKAASIREEVEESLRRLQVDVIDLYQIHWPNPDEDIEEGWTTLAALKAEGKVRHIGVSNFNVNQLARAQKIAPVSSLQPPYSLLQRDIEKDVLDFCLEHAIGVIVYSPMASGLLTGTWNEQRVQNLPSTDWRSRNPNFTPPRLYRNLALAKFLAVVGQEHGRSAGEIALAWTLHHPAVTAAIVGGRHPGQVDEIIGAGDFRLSETEIAKIEAYIAEHP
ncbi:aldo/keto reductase [Dictyobacter arantiisoli]|uniref:Oxidoreductase n=1 Tax=Dictyobacter arantiisoli TaxID=2014874 RepID=A0A5A5TBN4_9CHLR|nr:aldo/keto reductase [Dictyobacter arantiisoli]GCF08900.1 oxidoreductase [Dictyobacter arantiisoli]